MWVPGILSPKLEGTRDAVYERPPLLHQHPLVPGKILAQAHGWRVRVSPLLLVLEAIQLSGGSLP